MVNFVINSVRKFFYVEDDREVSKYLCKQARLDLYYVRDMKNVKKLGGESAVNRLKIVCKERG